MKTTHLIKNITTFIKTHNLVPQQSTIILGLSGGPDSVFLLHLLSTMHKQENIKLVAAHLDHEWRTDSDNDVKFCRDITKKLGIPFIDAKISDLNIPFKRNGSQEELGRKARRYFLESVHKKYNADFIAVAHHLQDQQETFFIRLIRGTSLTGLTAMKPKHGLYVRPLLEINKEEIINYLEEHKIPYLIDPSNELPDFLRNRIRATVLPALQQCDSRFDTNFLATLHRLQKTERFLEQYTTESFDTIKTIKEGKLHINFKQLLNLYSVIQYRILVHWLITEKAPFSPAQKFLDEILRFLQQPGSKEHRIHERWSLIKKKNIAFIQHSTLQ